MFYDQVKSLCDKRPIKITALARQLHLSPSAPNNWKEGSLPKVETVMKIAEYFGVTTDFLLYGDGSSTSNTIGDVLSSAVVQGNNGSHVSVSNSSGGDHTGDTLQGFEAELLRIFRGLDMKGKASMIQAAYTLEESQGDK